MLLLGACSSASRPVTTPSPPDGSTALQPPATTSSTVPGRGAPTPAGSPEGKAHQMLASVVVPSAARVVSSLPGREFGQPWEHPGCSPLVDASRLWVVGGDPSVVFAYLRAHPPTWIPYGGNGAVTGPPVQFVLSGYPAGPGWDNPSAYELDLTVASTGNGLTGIRADGQVVPPGSTCQTSGGAAAG